MLLLLLLLEQVVVQLGPLLMVVVCLRGRRRGAVHLARVGVRGRRLQRGVVGRHHRK